MWASLPVGSGKEATEVPNKKTPNAARGNLRPKLVDSSGYSKTPKTFSAWLQGFRT